jgi:aurora kinase
VYNGDLVELKSDNWGAGVVLFETVFARPPFSQASLDSYKLDWSFDIVEDQTKVADADPGCKDIINALILRDPAKRMTMEQVLEHPWVVAANCDC